MGLTGPTLGKPEGKEGGRCANQAKPVWVISSSPILLLLINHYSYLGYLVYDERQHLLPGYLNTKPVPASFLTKTNYIQQLSTK